jgi:hypothetical protein
MSRQLNVLHFNAQSATNKKIDIEQAAHDEQLDIIMLNETFLKPNKQFKLKGFTVHRHDRTLSRCVQESE